MLLYNSFIFYFRFSIFLFSGDVFTMSSEDRKQNSTPITRKKKREAEEEKQDKRKRRRQEEKEGTDRLLETLNRLDEDRLFLLKRVDALTRSMNRLNGYTLDDDEDPPIINNTASEQLPSSAPPPATPKEMTTVSPTSAPEPALPTTTTPFPKRQQMQLNLMNVQKNVRRKIMKNKQQAIATISNLTCLQFQKKLTKLTMTNPRLTMSALVN